MPICAVFSMCHVCQDSQRCLCLGRPLGYFIFLSLIGFKRMILRNMFQTVLGAILGAIAAVPRLGVGMTVAAAALASAV